MVLATETVVLAGSKPTYNVGDGSGPSNPEGNIEGGSSGGFEWGEND